MADDDSVAVEGLMALGQIVQMKRPVAILFAGVEESNKMVEHFKEEDSSFPVLILPDDQNGTFCCPGHNQESCPVASSYQ